MADPGAGSREVRPTPGEATGARPRLARAPAERYGRRRPEPVVAGRGPVGRGLVLGIVAATLTAILWALLSAVLEIPFGRLFVAGFGGWAIGAAVRTVVPEPGTDVGDGGARRTGRRLPALAAVLAASAWLGGLALDYILGLVLLPASALSLPERMAQTPFVDAIAAQSGPVELLALVVLVVVAWRSAR